MATAPVTTNAPAMLKIEGEMMAIGKTLMTQDFIRELAYSILTPEQQETLRKQQAEMKERREKMREKAGKNGPPRGDRGDRRGGRGQR